MMRRGSVRFHAESLKFRCPKNTLNIYHLISGTSVVFEYFQRAPGCDPIKFLQESSYRVISLQICHHQVPGNGWDEHFVLMLRGTCLSSSMTWTLGRGTGTLTPQPASLFRVSPPLDCWKWDDEAPGLMFYFLFLWKGHIGWMRLMLTQI